MGRPSKKLSALNVKNASDPGRYADGDGLYLNVAPGGSKSWVFLWMKSRKRREMGLGSYPVVGLADARIKAEACRKQVADGLDPIEVRKRESAVDLTFGATADEMIESMKSGWRNAKHEYQWKQTLGDSYCKSLRTKAIATADTADVLEVLSPIWNSKPETASRLRGRIERVFDYAKAKGQRTADNPARWRGHLKNLLPPRRKLVQGHHAAMPYEEVGSFIARLRLAPAISARALEFLILTAARSGEVLGATWNEMDLKTGVWTVPANRMKAHIIHRVPLAPRALQIVKQLADTKINDFVFPGFRKERPLSNMAFEMLMRRMKVNEFTPHGFRSAFRDWVGDETSFPREIAEAALAHQVGDETERAYRRSDALERRRKLMIAWADYCDGKSKIRALRRA